MSTFYEVETAAPRSYSRRPSVDQSEGPRLSDEAPENWQEAEYSRRRPERSEWVVRFD